MGQSIVGTVEGTGSAINVQIGFKPKLVICANIDDAGAVYPVFLWFYGMGSGDAFKFTTAPAMSLATSNGIDQYAGTAGANSEGFTIGADADMNVSGETILYFAIE